MSRRFAILCPGQGGQHPAMFDLVRNDAEGLVLLQQYGLDERLGHPLDAILGDERLLFSNRCAQALMVAAGLAAWSILRTSLPAPELIAGYSIGELTAYGVADALSPTHVVDLAVARAGLMDTCLTHAPRQGLMSVSGVLTAETEKILREHDAFVAIETGFDTLIAGGRSDDLEGAQQRLTLIGARARLLPVGIASHTPLMQDALKPFSVVLKAVPFSAPAVPVLAGVSGQVIRDSGAARDALVQQLVHTVRWAACMDACAESGVDVALELGPGAALSRMLHERHPHIECRSLSEFRSISGAATWLQNRLC